MSRSRFDCGADYPGASMGVSNITEKIVGSDGDFFVSKMGAFVGEAAATSQKFLAVLMLHYIHLPHPAMPTYHLHDMTSMAAGIPSWLRFTQYMRECMHVCMYACMHVCNLLRV
eukprot:COSAG01_NODE_9225_length_2513_cov_9.411350_1_plen_114_part_00